MLFEHRNLARLSLQCLYECRFLFRIFNSTDLEIMALLTQVSSGTRAMRAFITV